MAFNPARNYPARTVFKPMCTHLTMTRLYGTDRCESCHRSGSFGWVYRCTQDRDELIEQAAEMGFSTAFDQIGHDFTGEMASNIRRGSRAAREEKFSFFSEITPEQMASYRPDQIATILKQRDELHSVIRHEKLKRQINLPNRFRPHGADGMSPESALDSPWCRNDEECHYKICGYCRPGSADRAYISMNAVANGELPPTAATGYGFHILRMRPVIDADVLKTIGMRTPPKRRSIEIYEDSSYSDCSMMEMLDYQISQSCGQWRNDHKKDTLDQEAFLPLLPSSPGQLKHSPACENLAAYVEPVAEPATELTSKFTSKFTAQGSSVRPPWTPPPSPSLFGRESMTKCHVLGLAAEPSVTDGRSSVSLKTNPVVRNQILSSVPSPSALAYMQQSGYSIADGHEVPYLPESAYDVGLTLPFDPEAYELARSLPLTPPDVAEEHFFHEAPTTMMDFENREGVFMPAPLKVEHGVAVLEESVELGVPDVITQA